MNEIELAQEVKRRTVWIARHKDGAILKHSIRSKSVGHKCRIVLFTSYAEAADAFSAESVEPYRGQKR